MDEQRFLADTNCLIAVLQTWHHDHIQATREIGQRLDRRERLIVSAHSLAETYSVLTRLPAQHRMSPIAARSVILTSIVENAEVTALSADAYLHLIHSAPDRNILGGRVYDALIVACAVEAGVEVLLTFNARHFADLAPSSLRIVVPS